MLFHISHLLVAQLGELSLQTFIFILQQSNDKEHYHIQRSMRELEKKGSKLRSHSFLEFLNTVQTSYSSQIHCINSKIKPQKKKKKSYNSKPKTKSKTHPESTASRTNMANLSPFMKRRWHFGGGRTHLHRPQ